MNPADSAADPITDLDADERAIPFERFFVERWKLITLIFWVGTAIVLVAMKWGGIHWFALGDTDDNMRFDQVRDWLNGQGWYDLRQYRLDPPDGFSIHWSRLVDLPLAAMMVVVQPIFGGATADRVAVAVAPMLPMLPAFLAMAVTVRRLISPIAYPMALAILVCAGATMSMWTPLRIDHHGWQLAFLMITVAGLTDPDQRRSGLTVAISSALSMTIGLELLPYCAFAGAAIALHWAWDRAQAPRMRAYGLSLAVTTAICFVVFASNDNWHEVCDALSPVWLVTVGLAALLLAGLAALRVENPWVRFALVMAAGAVTIAVYGISFPNCFGHRLEGVSPELDKLWLSHVREARPIYTHGTDYVLATIALPVAGAIGGLIALWRLRGTREGAEWLPIILFGIFAGLLLLWQARTGPSAQMLAVPGATYLALLAVDRTEGSRWMLVRVVGPVLAFVFCSGLLLNYVADNMPNGHKPAIDKATGKPRPDVTSIANRRCPGIPALAPIEALPPAIFLTHVDLGPRLITLTHHSAIAGPYHRNGEAILDVEHAFRGSPDQAHAIIAKHHASYVLICPHLSEATIYQAEAPHGFYTTLSQGAVPAWLQRMPLPDKSPYQLFKVIG